MPFLPKLIKIYKNLRKFYEKFTKNCCKNRSKFRKNVNIDIQTPIPNPRQSRHPYLPPMKTHRRYRKFTKNWHKIYENFLKLFAKFYKIFENRWIFVKIGQNRQKWVSKPLRGPPGPPVTLSQMPPFPMVQPATLPMIDRNPQKPDFWRFWSIFANF